MAGAGQGMAAIHMMDAVWTRQILDVLTAAHVETDPILHRLGINQKLLLEPHARLPFKHHAVIMEAASQLLHDPLLGLRFGLGCEPRDAGLPAFVGFVSANLGEALRHTLHCLSVHTSASRVELLAEDEAFALTHQLVDPSASGGRQVNEATMGFLLAFCRLVTQRRLIPTRLELIHPPHPDQAEARRLLGAPILYGQLRNALVGPISWLRFESHHADDRLRRLLESYANNLLQQRGRETDLVGEVQAVVLRRLASGRAELDSVAEELGMSPRALARRLAEQDHSFGKLVDQLRHALAENYLATPDLRVSQIAALLGYANPPAFTHAYRRWTGRAPSEGRA
jgi:AraC-like DNA-binding protein